MAIPDLLSYLTNYPKCCCQIGGDIWAMMNDRGNQPIKKNPSLPMINGLDKQRFTREIGPFVSSPPPLTLFFIFPKQILGAHGQIIYICITNFESFSHLLTRECNMANCFGLKTTQVTLVLKEMDWTQNHISDVFKTYLNMGLFLAQTKNFNDTSEKRQWKHMH